jgi:mannose-1-phosphate guanylyltransferase
VNAMILAAGRGTRLGPLGRETPKVLVEVGGEPMLARQIRYLDGGGADRIVINAHHLADQIEAFVSAHPRADRLRVVLEPSLLGTAGGVLGALEHLGEGPFAVLYGDVLIDEPLDAVLETHLSQQADATLTVYSTHDIAGKGTVEVTEDGTIVGFHEKTASSAGEALVNAGLYVVTSALLDMFPAGMPLDFGEDVFPAAIASGRRLIAHRLGAPVIDMGTPEMLELAQRVPGKRGQSDLHDEVLA